MGLGDSFPQDQDIEVPTAIIPVVHLPGPFRNPTTIVITDVQRESFLLQAQATKAASQAETSNVICTFGRGLWRISLLLHHHADFTSAPGAVGAELFPTNPAGAGQLIARLFNIANAVLRDQVDSLYLFPEDSWAFNLRQGATGVGQTMFSSVEAICLRMN